MFENLADRLQSAFKNVTGQAKITETNVKDAMRDVRMALLEADVNFKVAKDFVAKVQAESLGDDVLLSVSPAQQMVKIVHDHLVEFLGGDLSAEPVGPGESAFKLPNAAPGRPVVVMMLGLQGAGKTTFCGKLAKRFQKEGRKPLLVACDVCRPAAVTQLQVVGGAINVPVHAEGVEPPAVDIAKRGVAKAIADGLDLVIVDTAGRLHIDDTLMDELVAMKAAVKPDFTFLVADAMTGQDAVASASAFHGKVGIDGVCLTKMDGDARGGAALSIKSITGKPVVFVGTGEKVDDLQEFHPERMAGRILGMGDVVSLVEKAQEAFDEKEAAALEKKMRANTFTLHDFLNQMQQLKRMGPLKGLLEMLPGVGSMLKDVELPEKDMKRTEAIIQSMTMAERENPAILNGSRRARIARGSGSTAAHVNALLNQFEQAKSMMQGMMKMTDRMKGAGLGPDATAAEARAAMQAGASNALSPAERAKRLARKEFEKQQRKAQAKNARQRRK